MKKNLCNSVFIMFFLLSLSLMSCADRTHQEAEKLMQQAEKNFADGCYDETLALIDTIRNKYPKAIEVRKKALVLYADASEKQAQQRLDKIVAELDKAESEYDSLNKIVTGHKRKNKASRDELTRLTLMGMHRDSVKTMFDAECEKIKYIRKKRNESSE